MFGFFSDFSDGSGDGNVFGLVVDGDGVFLRVVIWE